MPAGVNAVAVALQDALGTISGLRAYANQPEQLNPPFAYPELTRINYHRTMNGGVVTMEWTVHVIVGRYTDRTAFAALDGFLSYSGATSVRAALEADTTLGGVVQTVVLSEGMDITSLTSADAEFLRIELHLTVHA